MNNKIRIIFEKILKDHYIKKDKCGLWILPGESENSFIGITEEGPIEYQLFLHLNDVEKVTEKEMGIFLHEVGHLISLETIRRKEGDEAVRLAMSEYEREKERLLQVDEEERQVKYKEVKLEKEADRIAFQLEKVLKEEGLYWMK